MVVAGDDNANRWDSSHIHRIIDYLVVALRRAIAVDFNSVTIQCVVNSKVMSSAAWEDRSRVAKLIKIRGRH